MEVAHLRSQLNVKPEDGRNTEGPKLSWLHDIEKDLRAVRR